MSDSVEIPDAAMADFISFAVLPASSTQAGQCLGAPDVCLTPAPPLPNPVPMPYPNTAMMNQATKTSIKVKFASKAVVTTKSEIPSSMGDEAGVQKGVMSGMNMGKVTIKMGSSKVKAEGQPVAHLGSLTAHNGMNANAPAGAQVALSQSKVLIAP